LRPLRERREWLDVQDELQGTVKAATKASLRAEAKQPFRLTRTFIFGGLGAAAALAFLITATRVAAIIAKGGESPELQACHPPPPTEASLQPSLASGISATFDT
jgi:Low psii accumulation1 / Rep27